MTEEFNDSYLTNCLVMPRDDQRGPMFDDTVCGVVRCRLDRYAIIPIEEYERLTQGKEGSL
jgi:hypothetical protein